MKDAVTLRRQLQQSVHGEILGRTWCLYFRDHPFGSRDRRGKMRRGRGRIWWVFRVLVQSVLSERIRSIIIKRMHLWKKKILSDTGVQEKLGIMNNGQVYAVFDYEAQHADELSLKNGDSVVVLRKGDDNEREWWWSKLGHKEGYVPRNLLGVSITDYKWDSIFPS